MRNDSWAMCSARVKRYMYKVLWYEVGLINSRIESGDQVFRLETLPLGLRRLHDAAVR